MKTVLITGASSGFGRLAVTEFLRQGWRVIATMRQANSRVHLFKGEAEQFGDRLVLLELDVTSAKDRENIGRWIKEENDQKLDALIANAGFGVFGVFESLPEDQIRRQLEVNFIGTVLTTQTLLPALRNSRGRLIAVSSVCGYLGLPIYSMYCASKFALEGWLESLSHELAPWGVSCTLIEPGGFDTGFISNETLVNSPFPTESPYSALERGLQRRRKAVTRKMGDPQVVVRAMFRAATTSSPPLRVRCGKDAFAVFLLKTLLPGNLFDRLMKWAANRVL